VDTTVTALGVTRRAVLCHSPTLHAAQARGLDQTLAKAHRRLGELQTKLARGKTRRQREAVEAEIAAIVRPRWVGQVITTTLTGERPGCACPGAPTPAPAAAWKPSCSASGSCSPTATPGRWLTWSPPTAPSPRSKQAFGR
jgi:hypothetical protein